MLPMSTDTATVSTASAATTPGPDLALAHHCATCCAAQLPPEPCCRGWFVDAETGEVQRCDECRIFLDDEEAALGARIAVLDAAVDELVAGQHELLRSRVDATVRDWARRLDAPPPVDSHSLDEVEQRVLAAAPHLTPRSEIVARIVKTRTAYVIDYVRRSWWVSGWMSSRVHERAQVGDDGDAMILALRDQHCRTCRADRVEFIRAEVDQ